MSKGEQTREAILDRAVGLASRRGLGGLTIGALADDLNLSKSGLFAHFGSKQALQLGVLEAARERFVAEVVRPALKEPRGAPRIQAIFKRWFAWDHGGALAGGCVLGNSTRELAGQPGPLNDFLVGAWREWHRTLVRSARIAVEEGHFSPATDPEQFAHDMNAIMWGARHAIDVLHDPLAQQRTHKAFDNLMAGAGAGATPTAVH